MSVFSWPGLKFLLELIRNHLTPIFIIKEQQLPDISFLEAWERITRNTILNFCLFSDNALSLHFKAFKALLIYLIQIKIFYVLFWIGTLLNIRYIASWSKNTMFLSLSLQVKAKKRRQTAGVCSIWDSKVIQPESQETYKNAYLEKRVKLIVLCT